VETFRENTIDRPIDTMRFGHLALNPQFGVHGQQLSNNEIVFIEGNDGDRGNFFRKNAADFCYKSRQVFMSGVLMQLLITVDARKSVEQLYGNH
jgi:hypothetical protein